MIWSCLIEKLTSFWELEFLKVDGNLTYSLITTLLFNGTPIYGTRGKIQSEASGKIFCRKSVFLEFGVMRLVLVVFAAVSIIDGGIYIDRLAVDTDLKICNASLVYVNNKNGDFVLNATFQNFKTITKILVYTKVKIAEDQNDKTFRREIYSTVCDAEKMVNGMRTSAFLRKFSEKILKSLDFQFKTPFVPVSSSPVWNVLLTSDLVIKGLYKAINMTFANFNWNLNTQGTLNLRVIGRLAGSNATKYFGTMAFFGGVR